MRTRIVTARKLFTVRFPYSGRSPLFAVALVASGGVMLSAVSGSPAWAAAITPVATTSFTDVGEHTIRPKRLLF